MSSGGSHPLDLQEIEQLKAEIGQLKVEAIRREKRIEQALDTSLELRRDLTHTSQDRDIFASANSATAEIERLKAELSDIDGVIGYIWPPSAESRAKHVRNIKARLDAGEKWRQLVSDLDRCPHGRHEGDNCAGNNGPGIYDGGCKGGVSLGDPLLGRMAVLGVNYRCQLIREPEERNQRGDVSNWIVDTPQGDMLHHYLPGYVPGGLL